MFTQKSFYRSREWESFRLTVIDQKTNKNDGLVYCDHCGKPILKAYDLIVHHKIELNDVNVNDYNVSLNPEYCECVHFKCHNEIHNRFTGGNHGYKPPAKKVYIVYGSPCAGKSTWVREVATKDDIVIDLDKIWECISINNIYIKPPKLKSVVFDVRDKLYDIVKYRSGKWNNAYVITGSPLIGDRERLIQRVGADECILINTPKDECINRAINSDRSEEWLEYINDWFDKYQE